MNTEEKELLLRDLCCRLPYGVKCAPVITNGEINTIGGYCDILNDFFIKEVGGWFNISMIKPYLRSMTSITEEEKLQLVQYACIGEDLNGEFIDEVQRKDCHRYVDWLNSHHFDYNGLISKGLALEAKEGMYNVK